MLLGLFFITIGTLLDLQLLFSQFWLVLLLVVGLQIDQDRRSSRWSRAAPPATCASLCAPALVVGQGGEFGFALLTLMLNDRLATPP